MAAITVIFNGVRYNASDSASGWGNFSSSGGAPSAESPLAYQNQLVVNKKITSSSLGGIDYTGGTSENMTSPSRGIWYIKAYISDSFDLNSTFGVNVVVGSSQNNYYSYNIAGSGSALSIYNEYPPQGGYLLTGLNPNIAVWRDSTQGSPNLAAVTYFGLRGAFVVGAAKAENLALDAIDIGTGLEVSGGGGVDPKATFQDFVEFDQNTITNRYGVVQGRGSAVSAIGQLKIGSASTAAIFEDSDTVLTFKDGFVSNNQNGITVYCSFASTDIIINSLVIGEGTKNGTAANDTRPTFIANGGAGSCTIGATFRNFDEINVNAQCTIDGADIEFETLVLNTGATLINSICRVNVPTAGVAGVLGFAGATVNNVTFVQVGTGYSISINTAGTYTFDNLKFNGFGANGSGNAAIRVSAAGLTTINIINGGDTPTFNSTGGGTVVINNAVTVAVNVIDASTNLAVNGARVYILAGSGGDLTEGTVILSGLTDSNGDLSTSFNFTNPQPITGVVRKSTSTPLYKESSIVGSIVANVGYNNTIPMISDE